MPCVAVVFTAKRVVVLTVMLVLVYIFWNGPQRFYLESYGTWILSPAIYVRLLPLPYGNWLLTSLCHHRALDYALCAVPVLMLGLAVITAIHSLRKNSLPFALFSFGLTAAVFSVYHYLQPMGISVVYL